MTGSGDALDAYRRWAIILFSVALAVVVIVLLVVVVTVDDLPVGPRLVGLALIPSLIGAVAMVVLVVGLVRNVPSAVHAVAPVCVLLIVSGLVRLGSALGEGRLDIPLEAIGAILVLSRRPATTLMPELGAADRRTLLAVVGVIIATQVIALIEGLVPG